MHKVARERQVPTTSIYHNADVRGRAVKAPVAPRFCLVGGLNRTDMPGIHGDRCKHPPRTRTQESGPRQGQETVAAAAAAATVVWCPHRGMSAHAVRTTRIERVGVAVTCRRDHDNMRRKRHRALLPLKKDGCCCRDDGRTTRRLGTLGPGTRSRSTPTHTALSVRMQPYGLWQLLGLSGTYEYTSTAVYELRYTIIIPS
ncbi:uncharacterized protein CBL_11548 [Carabus blaptoides fortunei]